MNYLKEKALKLHEDNRGKIEIKCKVEIANKDDLSLAYTPGVAEPCLKIANNESDVYKYTNKGNLVAVVTDGTAVLGLGDLGASGAYPVMEGKAALFKAFANVDAVPICLSTTDPDEIVQTVKHLAPTFGGINLEDISAPRCFYIEERLKEELDIPVFHDDQHGTAVVVMAALINALKVVKKSLKDIKIVVNGIGAAGGALAELLLASDVGELVLVDKEGILYPGMKSNTDKQEALALRSNNNHLRGDLSVALESADVFIGVSKGNLVTTEMVKKMNSQAIIFAMANPVPEIYPEDAAAGGAFIIGTGRSDFPNQINNVLAFPGIFRGALDAMATDITEEMKLAAAQAIASVVSEDELNADYIIPDVFNADVVKQVALKVAEAARKQGAVRSR